MPSGYEAGLRIVEHYGGRGSANKQTRGIFPSINAQPEIRPGRVIRNRSGLFTGTAAQGEGSVTAHGVRPTASFPMDAIPEDILPVLMAFFHNVEYTVVTPNAGRTGSPPTGFTTPYTEVGTFKFGMIDARPDAEGAVVGVYDPDAVTYPALVAVSDLYSIGLEWLYGHGDLGDTDNGVSIDNFVANMLRFEVQRGPDQVLSLAVEGFGRDANELADFGEASWGPGINGKLSTQAVFCPDTFTLQALTINAGDVKATWEDWLDSFTLELGNGLVGRDPLGASGFTSVGTGGRPSAALRLGVGHIDPGFITAMVNAQKITTTLRFSNGANETMDIVLPNLKVSEEFVPNVGGVDSDITAEIPMVGLIDPETASPLVEIDVTTEFDVRTLSFFRSTTLAQASAYIV